MLLIIIVLFTVHVRYHHTGAVSLVYALRESLAQIAEEVLIIITITQDGHCWHHCL